MTVSFALLIAYAALFIALGLWIGRRAQASDFFVAGRRFGPGLIRKQVSLDMIVSVEPVRTNVIESWGIHQSRFGWLYNVSGFDAVAIRMKNGQHFALGTDEPEQLAARLKAARG